VVNKICKHKCRRIKLKTSFRKNAVDVKISLFIYKATNAVHTKYLYYLMKKIALQNRIFLPRVSQL